MAEPEDVLIEAAQIATAAARRLWLRCAAPDDRPSLRDLRRRLGLFVTTLFPDAPEIGVAEPPAPRSLLARLASTTSPHAPLVALASTDGTRIRLPATIETVAEAILPAYRLLALEQAARVQRGTPAWLPTNDRLVRDLFLLAEAAAVDRLLVELAPGLRAEIVAARRAARVGRPGGRQMPQEGQVELLVCALLEAAPCAPPSVIVAGRTPAESLAWARHEASRIRTLPGRYRGTAAVFLWGSAAPPPDEPPIPASQPRVDAPPLTPKLGRMPRRPRVRASTEDEDDPRPGMWLPRADDPQESVEDPMGLQRPGDRDEQPRPGDLGDSLSELPEARLVRTPEAAREILVSDERPPRLSPPRGNEPSDAALVYPEWDWRISRYQLNGALIRERSVPGGDPAWADQAVRRHAGLIRRVRRDFERLRPRRQTLRRQPEGVDLDIDAYVVSAADRLAGAAPDGRLYLDERRVRRDAAVLVLVDASASTDGWLTGARRVIDVGKEGLLIVGEALAALNERHAVFAFRGEGAGRVDLLAVKRFDEAAGARIRSRIAALEPDGYTRLGAALRHATALLAREPARHRLLLLLSDGRPNDVDIYEGRYGLEDTRQALAEARLQGIRPFCLTIDREAPHYASRVFGDRDHAVLRHPKRLPEVLVAVLRRLLCG